MVNGTQAKNLPSLGENEICVLASIRRLAPHAYGVSVTRDIQRRARKAINNATVYTTLRRLEGRGFLESRQGVPVAKRGGRAKTFFELTEFGRASLTETRRRLERIWKE